MSFFSIYSLVNSLTTHATERSSSQLEEQREENKKAFSPALKAALNAEDDLEDRHYLENLIASDRELTKRASAAADEGLIKEIVLRVEISEKEKHECGHYFASTKTLTLLNKSNSTGCAKRSANVSGDEDTAATLAHEIAHSRQIQQILNSNQELPKGFDGPPSAKLQAAAQASGDLNVILSPYTRLMHLEACAVAGSLDLMAHALKVRGFDRDAYLAKRTGENKTRLASDYQTLKDYRIDPFTTPLFPHCEKPGYFEPLILRYFYNKFPETMIEAQSESLKAAIQGHSKGQLHLNLGNLDVTHQRQPWEVLSDFRDKGFFAGKEHTLIYDERSGIAACYEFKGVNREDPMDYWLTLFDTNASPRGLQEVAAANEVTEQKGSPSTCSREEAMEYVQSLQLPLPTDPVSLTGDIEKQGGLTNPPPEDWYSVDEIIEVIMAAVILPLLIFVGCVWITRHLSKNARSKKPHWLVWLVFACYLHVAPVIVWLRLIKPVDFQPPAAAPPMLVQLEPQPPPPPSPAQQAESEPTPTSVSELLPEQPAPALVVAKREPQKKPKQKPKEKPVPKQDVAKHVESPETKPSKAEQPVAQSSITDTNSHTTAAAASRVSANGPLGGMSATAQQAKEDWTEKLQSHLKRYQRYPEAAKRREQGPGFRTNKVRFTVDREGRVLSYELVGPSGNPLLDRATLDTIRKAQPLPPPPPEVLKGRDSIEITAPLTYELERI